MVQGCAWSCPVPVTEVPSSLRGTGPGGSAQTHRGRVFRYIRILMQARQPRREGDSQSERGIDPIRVEGLTPLRGFVAMEADAALGEVWDVPMLAELAGVLGALQPADIVQLRRGVGSESDPVPWTAAERLGVVHLVRDRDRHPRPASQHTWRIRDPDPGRARLGVRCAGARRDGDRLVASRLVTRSRAARLTAQAGRIRGKAYPRCRNGAADVPD